MGDNTVSQPSFTPYDPNYITQLVSAATLRTMAAVVVPTGFASWASQTIAQPIFTITQNVVFNLFPLKAMSVTPTITSKYYRHLPSRLSRMGRMSR